MVSGYRSFRNSLAAVSRLRVSYSIPKSHGRHGIALLTPFWDMVSKTHFEGKMMIPSVVRPRIDLLKIKDNKMIVIHELVSNTRSLGARLSV